MKERLIELLQDIDHYPEKTCPKYGKGEECGDCQYKLDTEKGCDLYARKADYMIAKGLIYPPCKVGDMVYYISGNPLNLSVQANTIYEAHISRMITTQYGTTLVIQIHNSYGCTEIPDINDWGKTVFLTKEEAEQALRKEDEGK